MENRIQQGGLSICKVIYDLVMDEILPGTKMEPTRFWAKFEELIKTLGPENKLLLAKRDELQSKIDTWYQQQASFDIDQHKQFLEEIDYLLPEGDAFQISTTNVDSEVAGTAGPQLVVPINNARFALNAANARWGSLFDAYYGTDVIAQSKGLEKGSAYNPARGDEVIKLANEFLDQAAPLNNGSHQNVIEYRLRNKQLAAIFADQSENELKDPAQLLGYNGVNELESLLLINNGLHIDIQLDRNHPIGEKSLSGVKDIVLESAISTILDFEDSVTAVDAEDKALAYKNWLNLMKGTLNTTFNKAGKPVKRSLNPDRQYLDREGNTFSLHGRSLLLVRNVGHAMYTDSILDSQGNEIPETFLDIMLTSLSALHDLQTDSAIRNSRTGSIYIVKPKMHGPEEVAFTNKLFSFVEDTLGLKTNTLKVGVMDEERRTTVNLKECIRAVSERLMFINTGFLDRTGDEIHTSMEAGAMLPKEAIKGEQWIKAYEDWNVDVGLECGLQGKAQIGKGMWPKPDEMQEMMSTKQAQPLAGASCAWVPSPTAATLHAIHYHQVNVSEQQSKVSERTRASLIDILTPPLMLNTRVTESDISKDLDNNSQSILGYVVRWIDQGIGCSKVADINNVGLMEDRATLRISSQHIANWLRHEICTAEQVIASMQRMAKIVDEQNSHDDNYQNMAPNYDSSIAFQAASDLIFKGCEQANGYTEFILHARRREQKSKG